MQFKIPKKKRLLKKFGGSEIVEGKIYSWSIEEGIRRVKEHGFKSKRSRKRDAQSQVQLDALYDYIKEKEIRQGDHV